MQIFTNRVFPVGVTTADICQTLLAKFPAVERVRWLSPTEPQTPEQKVLKIKPPEGFDLSKIQAYLDSGEFPSTVTFPVETKETAMSNPNPVPTPVVNTIPVAQVAPNQAHKDQRAKITEGTNALQGAMQLILDSANKAAEANQALQTQVDKIRAELFEMQDKSLGAMQTKVDGEIEEIRTEYTKTVDSLQKSADVFMQECAKIETRMAKQAQAVQDLLAKLSSLFASTKVIE
jgi:uncharacterized phage infection (PIP) family protein YhgE